MGLNVDDIMYLNQMMIGLGVPNQVDGRGYNKPDYARCVAIGRLKVPYTPEECFITLETLCRYKNTQLYKIKNELEEAYDKYKAIMSELYFDEYDAAYAMERAVRGIGRNKDCFYKEQLQTVAFLEEGVKVKFNEFVELDLSKFEGKWQKENDDSFSLYVPFSSLLKFVDIIRNEGRFGLEPDEALRDFIENKLEETLDGLDAKKLETEKEEAVKEMSCLVLTDTNTCSSYNIPLYELNANNHKLTELLWKAKEEYNCLSYVDTKTSPVKTIVSIKDNAKDAFRVFAKKNNIDCGCFDNWNKSNDTLIDVSTLDLPFTPHDFQIEDANKLISMNRALIGHDMGCGKTFIASLVGMSIEGSKLVVCPESLRLNWLRELERFDKGKDIKVIYSNDKEFKEYNRLTFGKDWTIMGYNTVTKFRNELLVKGFNAIFIDEAHNCKAVNNSGKPNSKRAEAVMSIAMNTDRCYLMTGTPMPTRNKDLYNELVMLNVLKKGQFFSFGQEYCDGYNNGFGWDFNGSSNTEKLHGLLDSIMVRRLKSDVLKHLTKQRIMIPVEPDKVAFRKYKQTEKHLYDMESDETYMGLAMTGRKQLSASRIHQAVDFANSLLEADESVVIVTEFNESMDMMLEMFGNNACCIRGGMKDADKQQAIDDFQSGKKKVCLLNVIAGGVGITLTKSSNMIICDYDWTPANMTQVEDRICRTGQTKPCNIYYLYCEDAVLDKIFIDMITDKSSNIDRVVDAGENSVDLADVKANNRSYLDLLKSEIRNSGKLKPKKRTKEERDK